ncbi:MAG: hypothetical protein HYY30_11945 [Chloroflexi bacterium]|nr:hypothetical protein [Chloroflexota bacterium]
MVQQDQVADASQLNQMVSWLEEQRRLDKDQVVRAQQDLERLALRIKELAAQVQQVGEDAKLERSRLAGIPFIEEGIRQLREQMGIVQQRLDAREQAQDREIMLRQAEAEREKKALVELAHQLGELSRQDEQHSSKIQGFAEDVRRARTDLLPVSERLDAVEKTVASVFNRISLLEEHSRRADVRVTALEQIQETLRADSAKVLQWQQAADLHWDRQITQWQEKVEEWRRDAGEHGNTIQVLAKQLSQAKDDAYELRALAGENRKEIEDHAASLLRLEAIRAHDREDVTRIEQAIEFQRRRVDEQSHALKLLQEQLLQNVQGLVDLQGRLEDERKRTDEAGIAFRQVEMKQRQGVDEVVELHKLLREQQLATTQQVQAWQRHLDDVRRDWEVQIAELQQLIEQQKNREAAELQRQILEVRERLNKYKGRVSS